MEKKKIPFKDEQRTTLTVAFIIQECYSDWPVLNVADKTKSCQCALSQTDM